MDSHSVQRIKAKVAPAASRQPFVNAYGEGPAAKPARKPAGSTSQPTNSQRNGKGAAPSVTPKRNSVSDKTTTNPPRNGKGSSAYNGPQTKPNMKGVD